MTARPQSRPRPHHRVEGRAGAPPLVLASSLGTTLELWDAQLPALAERFSVVRYDHPGHGESPAAPSCSLPELADDLVGLLDDLGLERVSLCGLSLGGAVAMQVALSAPERVDRLVLACTSARFSPADPWHERAATVRAHGMEAIAEMVLARFFGERTRRERPDLVGRFRARFTATDAEAYARCCDGLAEWDARGRLGAIAAPTLVIVGSDDPSTPPVHGEAIAAEIPGARLVLLEGAAHLANVERSAAFTEALVAHLEAA
jgi:3-oxoadipate enol-lactonase